VTRGRFHSRVRIAVAKRLAPQPARNGVLREPFSLKSANRFMQKNESDSSAGLKFTPVCATVCGHEEFE
jgi:hypothetical protein